MVQHAASFLFEIYFHTKNRYRNNNFKLVIERAQGLADILRSALFTFAVYKAISLRLCVCSHSNETRAPIANPPNSAQLEGTPHHSPKLHPGPSPRLWLTQNVIIWPTLYTSTKKDITN